MAKPTSENIRGALTRYRVMAYVVGVMLLLLVAAMIGKYGFHVGSTTVVAQAHGFLFMIYALLALDLSIRMRWSLPRIVFVVISGTIPFLSFVAERKVAGWVAAELGTPVVT